MIGLVNIGIGNYNSLISALKKINVTFKVCEVANDFENVDKIIIPGVGAFGEFIEKLKIRKIDKVIKDSFAKNIPVLGICVGMQIMFSKSYEQGNHKGLDIISGNFRSLNTLTKDIIVPHVGWNECQILKKTELLYGIKNYSDFYFNHSYFLDKFENQDLIASTNYEKKIPSILQKKKLYTVQFHPEKSQVNGLKLLKNFIERC